ASKDLPANVVKAAFALVNTGDVSGVVDAGNGTYYILKQTGRRKAMTKSLDEAKAQIRNKLFREKRLQAQKDFIDNLRGQAKIEIDEANLAKVRIDTSATGDDGHGHDLVPPAPAPPAAGSATGSAEQPVP
ncbi:MAG: peptidylprolyl isomerase, partial [Acidobacteriota bacterium]